MSHNRHFSLITEKTSNKMNVLRRLKSRGRKSLFGCQWISKRETSISLNCFKYLNKLLYKTEDVSAGHVLTGTTVWSSLHGLLCRVLDILNEFTFFKGVWLNDWILIDSLKHLKTWSNTGLNFFFTMELTPMSCVQLQRWNKRHLWTNVLIQCDLKKNWW